MFRAKPALTTLAVEGDHTLSPNPRQLTIADDLVETADPVGLGNSSISL